MLDIYRKREGASRGWSDGNEGGERGNGDNTGLEAEANLNARDNNGGRSRSRKLGSLLLASFDFSSSFHLHSKFEVRYPVNLESNSRSWKLGSFFVPIVIVVTLAPSPTHSFSLSIYIYIYIYISLQEF